MNQLWSSAVSYGLYPFGDDHKNVMVRNEKMFVVTPSTFLWFRRLNSDEWDDTKSSYDMMKESVVMISRPHSTTHCPRKLEWLADYCSHDNGNEIYHLVEFTRPSSTNCIHNLPSIIKSLEDNTESLTLFNKRQTWSCLTYYNRKMPHSFKTIDHST